MVAKVLFLIYLRLSQKGIHLVDHGSGDSIHIGTKWPNTSPYKGASYMHTCPRSRQGRRGVNNTCNFACPNGLESFFHTLNHQACQLFCSPRFTCWSSQHPRRWRVLYTVPFLLLIHLLHPRNGDCEGIPHLHRGEGKQRQNGYGGEKRCGPNKTWTDHGSNRADRQSANEEV